MFNLAVAHVGSPFVSVYPFGSGVGKGLKYPNPRPLPNGNGRAVAFDVDGSVAIGYEGTPGLSWHAWQGGFSTRFADSVVESFSTITGVAFGRYAFPGTVTIAAGTYPLFMFGNLLAVSYNRSPFLSVYVWTQTQGIKAFYGDGTFTQWILFGRRLANPATLPTGTANGIALSPATNLSNYVAVAHATTPFFSVYPINTPVTPLLDPLPITIGVKIANPATLPTGTGNGVVFNSSGDSIAVAHDTTPFVSAYPFTGVIGVKYANPATLPTGNGKAVHFSPSGADLAVAHTTTPFISVYPFAAGFGTKYTNPATLPTGNATGVAFSPDGSMLAVSHEVTPFFSVYSWSTAGFGAKLSNPATLPTGTGNAVAWSQINYDIPVAMQTFTL